MTDPIREAFHESWDSYGSRGSAYDTALHYWQAAWQQSRREALREAAALYCHYCANGTPIVQKEYGRNEPRWHDTGDGRIAGCFATLIRAAAEEEGE